MIIQYKQLNEAIIINNHIDGCKLSIIKAWFLREILRANVYFVKRSS